MDAAWSVKADAMRTATQLTAKRLQPRSCLFSRSMTHFARLAIFFAIEPLFSTLRRFELEQDNALRVPVTFEYFGFAAAHDVFASVFFYGRTGEVLVFFVTRGSRMSISTIT